MNPVNKKDKIKKRRSMGLMLRLLVISSFLVLFFVSYKLFEQTYKQNQINQDIAQMQEEIGRLNQDNQDLSELISYLQTDDFKEKEAKDKLNLIKEGENLVLIKEKEVRKEEPKTEEKNSPEIVIDRPVYYYWWQLFFGLNES